MDPMIENPRQKWMQLLADADAADLKTRARQKQQTLAREIADTTVEFFTLRRGE